jgi:hypothetical protein
MEIPMSDHLTWHEEQRQRSRIAEQCAVALAEHLDGDWVRCDPHAYVVAIRSGDRRLTIRPERKATVWRVVITAQLPEGYDARMRLEPQETTVAADRSPSQIAGQVGRRLLTPEYDAAIAEVHAALAAERDRKASIAVALAEIEALIPGAGPYEHDGEGYTRFSGPSSWRGSFRVLSSSGEIDIELNWAPADLARDIAALIGKRLSTNAFDRPED